MDRVGGVESRALQAGVAGSIPAPSTHHLRAQQALVILAFALLPQMGSIGSNKKLFHSLNCPALLRWNRAQINLSHGLRRRVTRPRLDVAKEFSLKCVQKRTERNLV